MKKGLIVILAVLAIGTFGIFIDGGKEASAAGKTIKVGVNSENPPWIFSKDGMMTGFEADILEEFAKRAGYKKDKTLLFECESSEKYELCAGISCSPTY